MQYAVLSTPLRSTVAAAAILLLAAACDSPDPIAPTPRPPLEAAVWHVHAAEGQALPALVAHGLEGGVLVQDFLDSSRVRIFADGTWERRAWMSRFHDQAYHGPVVSLEVGTWMTTDAGYRFAAEPSGRQFTLASMTPGEVVQFPLRGAGDGLILATLRTVPPPPSVVGTYDVTEVRGVPVPSAIYVFNDYVEHGRVMSIHLVVDSARLALVGNGTYRHTIHYTEWEGPNRGGPTAIRHRWEAQDFGSWVRGEGTLISFESGWLQNHRFAGTVYDGARLELLHGISHGDAPVPVRYGRR